jgi:DNA-binding LacI/PurR family transcriptional regulator
MSQDAASRKISDVATRSAADRGRPIIGLLLDWVIGDYQEAFVQAVLDATRRRNATLLCFTGGSLTPGGELSLRNAVYHLAGVDNVDALIVASAGLGNAVGPAGVAKFCERFGALPLVSVSAELNGTPSIVVENDSGMRDLVTHLVRHHGYRRIAFVRGATSNIEVEGRYNAYRDVLKTNGIEVHEELIVAPIPGKDLAVNALEQLLDERHVRLDTLDAIVACDDATATAILRELERRDIRVPDQIAITGFDDQEESRYENPPLTTVRQPIAELGERAVQLAIDLLNGIPVPPRTVLPTQLVVRASCRCFVRGKSPRLPRADPAKLRPHFETALIERRELILAEIARSARACLGAAGAGWENRILHALLGSMRANTSDEFLRAVDEVLRATLAAGGEVRVLYDVLLALRGQALAVLNPASDQREHAELLFHEAASAVSEALERVQAFRRIKLKTRTRSVAGIVTGFNRWRSAEEIARRLAGDLATLGVGACYVAAYEPDSDRTRARLTFSYEGHRRRPSEEAGAPFPSQWLVPAGMAREDRAMGLLVTPLFFDDDDIGFMLIELGKCDASVFYVLPALISLALQHAQLSDSRSR